MQTIAIRVRAADLSTEMAAMRRMARRTQMWPVEFHVPSIGEYYLDLCSIWQRCWWWGVQSALPQPDI